MTDLIKLFPLSVAEGKSLQISHRLSKVTQPPLFTRPFPNLNSAVIMDVISLG